MPLYEYQCEACSHRFEVIQKFSDAPLEVCPQCGGVVRKLLSSPAIQFKGSGWYITDYAGGRSSAASSTNAGDGEAKSESKKESSDAKPAAASSTKSDSSSASSTSSSSSSSTSSTSKE